MNDGRWHFQHGPIDLVIACEGGGAACETALAQAWAQFQCVLADLSPQLPALRSPVVGPFPVDGRIATAMVDACRPFGEQLGFFITPMAAVAGSVADEIADCFRGPDVERAYVNNGGDIALCLAPGRHYDVGVVTNLAWPQIDGRFRIEATSPVRGIATSGWRGRSFSLGIADSVTVLARTAAAADAAATMIANQVDVDSPAVRRRPACLLKDDTDLGDRLVTVAVGPLSATEIQDALDSGSAFAEVLRGQGLIEAAALVLGTQACVVRNR
ncbi:MAG TPA: UPF0280 family protein [Lautropia sp.]|nr:UPF0280 family protein [Lautropia sp.]